MICIQPSSVAWEFSLITCVKAESYIPLSTSSALAYFTSFTILLFLFSNFFSSSHLKIKIKNIPDQLIIFIVGWNVSILGHCPRIATWYSTLTERVLCTPSKRGGNRWEKGMYFIFRLLNEYILSLYAQNQSR
jgi:hypothetical protein